MDAGIERYIQPHMKATTLPELQAAFAKKHRYSVYIEAGTRQVKRSSDDRPLTDWYRVLPAVDGWGVWARDYTVIVKEAGDPNCNHTTASHQAVRNHQNTIKVDCSCGERYECRYTGDTYGGTLVHRPNSKAA